MTAFIFISAAVLQVAVGQEHSDRAAVLAAHEHDRTEIAFNSGGSMTRSTAALGVMRREGHGALDSDHHSALIEQHVHDQVPGIRSCRHTTWKDTHNPQRMKLGTYCVDTSDNTADYAGNAMTQATLDTCTTWQKDGAKGKFQTSQLDCSQVDKSIKPADVISCRHPKWKDEDNPKRMSSGTYCVDSTARTADFMDAIITHKELNQCTNWAQAGLHGRFEADYVKDCMGVDQSNLISCGGHKAARCQLCTVIDPKTGLETPDKGAAWCYGDCTYYDEECHKLTAHNLHVERDNHTEGVSTTLRIPDLMNPNITAEDRELMDAAADRSIEEAKAEAEQRKSNEAAKIAEENDKGDKFIFMAICSGSGCLVCCACTAMLICCTYLKSVKKEEPLIVEEEGEEDFEEGEGEEGEQEQETAAF